MFTTANNHALDRGLNGLKRTICVLDQLGTDHVGTQLQTESERTLYKTIGGIRFAFVSYTYDTNSTWMNNKLSEDELYHINLFKEQDTLPFGGDGLKGSGIKHTIHAFVPEFVKDLIRDKSKADCGKINDYNSDKNKRYEGMLLEDIEEAKGKADYVCCCLHIGGQYNDDIGVYTDSIVKMCKEAGAHFIICNHPHCVLPITIDNKGIFVAYALGNFCYTPNWGYYVEGKYSDYSIAVHLIFSKERKVISDIRFSILKSVETNINTQVYNVYDLYNSESNTKDANQLRSDIESVLQRLFGHRYNNILIKEEYSVCEFVKH